MGETESGGERERRGGEERREERENIEQKLQDLDRSMAKVLDPAVILGLRRIRCMLRKSCKKMEHKTIITTQ